MIAILTVFPFILSIQVTHDVYEKIVIAGQQQHITDSLLDWPVNGGLLPERGPSSETTPKDYDILLTGHEDGSIRFWNCSDVILIPILHLKTAPLFISQEHDLEHHSHDASEANDDDDSDPPFRKAGQFDPYSDDPRLAVKKIGLCPKTGVLTVAGTAGHVVVASFDSLTSEMPLKVTKDFIFLIE